VARKDYLSEEIRSNPEFFKAFPHLKELQETIKEDG
jgi:hypothetical protein